MIFSQFFASATAAVLALIVGLSPGAADPELSEPEQAVVEAIEAAQPLPDTRIDALLAQVPASELEPASGAPLDAEREGWRLSSGEALVALKLDDGGVNLSAIVFAFDRHGDLLRSSEAYIVIEDGELHSTQWTDGSVVSEESISQSAFAEATSGAMNAIGIKAFSFSLSKFNSCLSSAGVSWFVVAMVASVCGLVGIPTAGVGFIACAVGTLGISSGTAGYCFAYATS